MLGEIVIIFSMLVLNAVFAAYEMALASVPRARLEALLELRRRGASAGIYMKGRMERSLAVVQVGITLAGAIAAATGGAGVDESLVPLLKSGYGLTPRMAEFTAVTILVIPLSLFTIIFAELVPKMFAISNKEAVVLALSPAMRIIAIVFYPAIFILEASVKRIMSLGSSEAKRRQESLDRELGLVELRAAATLAKATRLIGPLEERIVGAATQLSSRTVGDVMLPAADIAMIPDGSSFSDALIRAHINMHTRYPTCAEDGNPQTINGYVNFKDIVAALRISPADPRLKSIIRPIPSFNVRTSLAQALSEMIRGNVHISLVRDKGAGVLGLVTIEDIVADILGPIGDEYDRLPSHIHPVESGWLAGGGASISALAEAKAIPAARPGDEKRTIAEWSVPLKGGGLRPGGIISDGNLRVEVRKIRRGRLMEVLIRRPTAQGSPDGSS